MAEFHPALKTWITPLSEEEISLRTAYQHLDAIGNRDDDVPLMIQLLENPKFHLKGFGLFKGRVSLKVHDYIHIVLGRGLMHNDEAFVIGFTMGTSNRMSTQEKAIFSFIASSLYPESYRLTPEGKQIFKDAAHLGYVSDCQPLDTVDWEPLLDLPLKEVRAQIGLECDLLQAYYNLVAKRYPECQICQRLVR